MKDRINIAELLKDCPSGMELDCTCADNVVFDKIIEYEQIKCVIGECHDPLILDKYGRLLHICCPKCVIFPKGKTTWDGFQGPFKDGDIIFTGADCTRIGLGNTWISIFEENRNGGVATYVDYCNEGKDFYTYLDDKGLLCLKEDIIKQRLATEEEKQKLFKAIEDNGYKWNPESKTLEKLVEPSFLEEETNQENVGTKIELTGFMQMGKTASVIFNNENYEDEVELQFGDYKIEFRDGKTYAVKKKPKYPKTYKECCKVLDTEETYMGIGGHKRNLLIRFQRLLICRDAYWKIYGEQMGLGKPWEPDFNSGQFMPAIIYRGGFIQKVEVQYRNTILAFPTTEMREAFFENFKDLIELCKELL